MRRFLTVLYIFDNLVLALLTLGGCRIGETISSVAWIMEADGKLLGRIARPCIDFIMRAFEQDHCLKAYLSFQRHTGAIR